MSYVPPQGFPQQPYPPPYPPPTGYPPPYPPMAPQGPQGGGGADARSRKRRFGIFGAMAMTAFSPDVWRDVAKNWTGIGLMYLLVLLVITWTAVLIRGYSSFSHFLTTESHEFVDQFPAVTVTNGVVSIDKPQP